VLVLGDSYTFGWLVEEQYTYVELLQAYADSAFGRGTVQFLNGGVGGWGTADYLAFVEEFGERISPRVVLVFINSDDIGRSLKSGLYSLKDIEALELETHSIPVSTIKRSLNALPFYEWLLEHSHLLQFLRTTYLIELRGAGATERGDHQGEIVRPRSRTLDVDPALSRTMGRALFRRLDNWCRRHGAELLVTTPGFHFRLEGLENEPTAAFLQTADSFFEQASIPYRDITPEVYSAIKETPQDFTIVGEGHPNERGHKLIAHHAWIWLSPQIGDILDLPAVETR
jgi:lysophospholipase L1-like esterase